MPYTDGGAAGGGKTWAILLEPVRHLNNKDFGAVIFRQNSKQITNEGGLWDASFKIYTNIPGNDPVKTPRPKWRFKSGSRITFENLEREDSVYKFQGAEITLIEFDELTHFSESQFFYMLSRNRSTCGIRPYVRATCNPDADSWLAKFISWWIDQDTGYAIPERSGVIRYMARINEEIIWGNSPKEVIENGSKPEAIKSVTFIASTLQDNKILMKTNPEYIANLESLSIVERERLLYGNWKIKASAGMFFKRSDATMVDEIPDDVIKWVRGWDLAATDESEGGEPAYTAGVLIGKRRNGRYIIADVTNVRLRAGAVRDHILNTAKADKAKHHRVRQRLPQDPGQAGKAQAADFVKMLAGFSVAIELESGSKETRAEPMAAQWQHGNIDVLIAPWNEQYFSQLESFPESKFKDMVDAGSSAFGEIEKMNTSAPPPATTSNIKESYWNK